MAVGDLFAVDPDSGFLLVTRALDREEQAEYQLQVGLGQVQGKTSKEGRGTNYSSLQVTLESEDGRVLWGPQPVSVHVRDENDQVPHFSQAIYRVQLSQGTKPGEWPGQPDHSKFKWALMGQQRMKSWPESQHRDRVAVVQFLSHPAPLYSAEGPPVSPIHVGLCLPIFEVK